METQALVIGAGPYGLGIAQHLWGRGVETVAVGEPFALWFDHTLSNMRLRSDWNASSITSPDGRYGFEEHVRRVHGEEAGDKLFGRTPVGIFRRYLEEVVERLPFDLQRRRVVRLEGGEEPGDGFAAELDDGSRIAARAVVVATGIGPHRYFPPALGGLPRERLLHSWDCRRIEALAGQRVLVVGGGQSAAETVEALAEANRVTWAMRREPMFFREPLRLPTPLFKAVLALSPAFYRLPRRLRDRLASTFFRPTITPNLKSVYEDGRAEQLIASAEELALSPNGSTVASPTAGRFDLVVSATGYRCTLGGLSFLQADLQRRLGPTAAAPQLDDDFQTPVPGLYMAGGIAEATYGPAQRFILGSWHAARRIAGSVGRQLGA